MAGQSGSFFNDVEMAPPIEVFALIDRFKKDDHPKKVNLSVGGIVIKNITICPICSFSKVTVTSKPAVDTSWWTHFGT